MKKNQISKSCKVCSNEFSIPLSQCDKKFCSMQCYAEWQHNHPSNTGRTYIKKGERIGINTEFKKGLPSISSELLKQKWKEGSYNNRPRQTLETKIKISITQRKITFEQFNKFSIGENKRLRNSPEYINWRNNVFIRDNFTCQDCGIKNIPIEAHHIKSFALFPEFRYDLNNGITYCVDCHIKNDIFRKRTKIKGVELPLKNSSEM